MKMDFICGEQAEWVWILVAVIAFGGPSGRATEHVAEGDGAARRQSPAVARDGTWSEYWLAHGVVAVPPESFLQISGVLPPIGNFTYGAMKDDAAARRWVLADLRRNAGDSWAVSHLRMDIVNAGVLGPPGLSGDGAAIEREKAHGTVEIRCETSHLVAAALLGVPEAMRGLMQLANDAAFAVALVFEDSGQPCLRVKPDGATESLRPARNAGELTWQVDLGEYREEPGIGPIWYQSRGITCTSSDYGPLCAFAKRVRPLPHGP